MASKRKNPTQAQKPPVISEKPDYTPTMTPAYAEIYDAKKGKKA